MKPVSTPCINDRLLKPDDFVKKGVLAADAARVVLKCLFGVRMVRCYILWTVDSPEMHPNEQLHAIGLDYVQVGFIVDPLS